MRFGRTSGERVGANRLFGPWGGLVRTQRGAEGFTSGGSRVLFIQNTVFLSLRYNCVLATWASETKGKPVAKTPWKCVLPQIT
jgi:hypothetical protein